MIRMDRSGVTVTATATVCNIISVYSGGMTGLRQHGDRILGTIQVPQVPHVPQEPVQAPLECEVTVSCTATCKISRSDTTTTFQNTVIDHIPVQSGTIVDGKVSVDFEMPLVEYGSAELVFEEGNNRVEFSFVYVASVFGLGQLLVSIPFNYTVNVPQQRNNEKRRTASTYTYDSDSTCCQSQGPVTLTLRHAPGHHAAVHADLHVDNGDNRDPVSGSVSLVYRVIFSVSDADGDGDGDDGVTLERVISVKTWGPCQSTASYPLTLPLPSNTTALKTIGYAGEKAPWPMRVAVGDAEYAEAGTFTVWAGLVLVAVVDGRRGGSGCVLLIGDW